MEVVDGVSQATDDVLCLVLSEEVSLQQQLLQLASDTQLGNQINHLGTKDNQPQYIINLCAYLSNGLSYLACIAHTPRFSLFISLI